MPLIEEENPRRGLSQELRGFRRQLGRYNELFKRVYTKDEIKEDGVVIHVSVKNGELNVHELLVQQVGNKAIKFDKKGILGKQIPLTSIGFVNLPKIKGLEISIEGTALSSDFNELVETLLHQLENFISQQRTVLNNQHRLAKNAYFHWKLDCEHDEE
ncbi:hypothetical protein [Priestia sp. P5]|uniref:hypothetical protein n=1 Tax=Priestia sp. P5 TaxID=2917806 RepID=UPI0006496BE6|nr:hypothetical protein [Priestia sp. P5]MDG0059017.1 hypothetical protein [Priestia sp. P5]